MKKNVVFILIAFAVVTCFAQFGRRIGNPSRARPGLGPRGSAAAQQPDAANSAAEDAIKNAPRGTNGVPALVFDKAPMELVLKAYGDLVQKTIIPAPDLPKAEITLKSLEGQVLEKDEYLEAIEVVLGMNGVVLEPRGEKFLRALAKKTYLSYPKMREWRDLARQLEQLCRHLNLSFAETARRTKEESAAAIHRSILAGLLGRLGHYDPEERDYRGAYGLRFAIHPSSSLAKKQRRKDEPTPDVVNAHRKAPPKDKPSPPASSPATPPRSTRAGSNLSPAPSAATPTTRRNGTPPLASSAPRSR